jgi:hypothetical protein
VKLAIAVLLMFHPSVERDPFVIADALTAWFAVHIGMLILTPALGIVAWLVVSRLTTPAAHVARLAILPFVAFHAAYDALAGIGTGLLVQAAAGLPPDHIAGATALVTGWWANLNPHWIWTVSALSWAAFALCAAVAHWRSGSHLLVVVGLGLAAPFVYLHAWAPAAITLVASARPPGRRSLAHKTWDSKFHRTRAGAHPLGRPDRARQPRDHTRNRVGLIRADVAAEPAGQGPHRRGS